MPLPLLLIGAAAILGGSAAVGVAATAREYKYRQDEGLDFLAKVPSDDLDPLVEFLVEHYNQDLTYTPAYQEHYPDHRKYWREIATEIQTYGGNTISNIYRGEGIPYREILCDVCDRLKVSYDKGWSIVDIELKLLEKTLGDTLDKLDPDERAELIRTLAEEDDRGLGGASDVRIVGNTGFQIAQSLLRSSGFAPYKWAVIVAHRTIGEISKVVLGKGLPFVAGPLMTKSTHLLLGPIATAISAAWTIYDIHGPAYRVTVRSVFYIICLRLGQRIHALDPVD